jgi:hypothetical protein
MRRAAPGLGPADRLIWDIYAERTLVRALAAGSRPPAAGLTARSPWSLPPGLQALVRYGTYS